MAKQSAGLLLYRMRDNTLEVFLVHPGGPLWAKKDMGAWSIPKGEFDEEEPLLAAKREFHEETGIPAPQGEYIPLKAIHPIESGSTKGRKNRPCMGSCRGGRCGACHQQQI